METIKLKLPGENDFFSEEAYKVLRTNLQFCGQELKVICLTSCNENEGKSTVTLHLGKSFSALGKKVLVIDADMRKSVIAGRNTSVRNPKGLSEALTGLCPVKDCIYTVKDTTFDIIFSGQYPPNPVELLSGKYFAKLIDEAREKYDYIFIDLPPLGQVVDAAVVAERCDGCVLVLGNTRTSYRKAQEVIDLVRKSGCKMLGVVRNNRRKKKNGAYGDGYGYRTAYAPGTGSVSNNKK